MKKELLATVATLAAVACLLAACSGTEEKIPGNEPGSNPSDRVALCIEQASMSQVDAVDTRAPEKITTGSMGVFLEGHEGEYVRQRNVCYTATGDAPLWLSNDGLFLGTTIAQVCAYWPYVAGDTHNDSHAIPLTTQVYNEKQDLCFAINKSMSAPNNSNPNSHVISFEMAHAYALLELNLKRNTESKIPCPVSKIEITATGAGGNGTGLNGTNKVNITTGVYDTATPLAQAAGTFVLNGSYTIPANSAESVRIPALLIVPTAPTTTTFKFTLTAFDPAITVSGSTLFSNITFEKGKKYIVNLTVNSTSVGVGSVTVLDWTDTPIKPDGGGNGFVPLPPVTP